MDEQQAIEQDFLRSWDHMEVFFTDFMRKPSWEWLEPMRNLMSQLRERGYDKQLRAGQSLYMLGLSRSRQHGLRREQVCLFIELLREGGMEVHYRDSSETITVEIQHIELTKELEELLARLLAQPID
jgi:hypothetical protein